MFELRTRPNTWKLIIQPIFSHIKTSKSISFCTNWREYKLDRNQEDSVRCMFGRLNIAYDIWKDEVWALLELWLNGSSDECMRQGRSDITTLFDRMHFSQMIQTTWKRRTPPFDPVAETCVVLLHAELLIHVGVNVADTTSRCILSDQDGVWISKSRDVHLLLSTNVE
jgi:hypothetical protein